VSRIRKNTFYLEFCMGTREDHPKKYLYYLKSEKKPDGTRGYPMEFTGSTPIPKIIIGTSNLPIRTKFFQKKKYVYYLKSVKEPQIRMGATE
jgi:hypothetical protein